MCLKLARVSADLTDSGRLFYTVGPATEGSVSKLSSCPWNNVCQQLECQLLQFAD